MMIKKIENNEGSIGIGAMIVFIALILVAAVASAVIIQTAETLQQNAQSVGDDTQDEIAGKIQIHGAFYAASGADIHLIFSLSPGSDAVRSLAVNYQIFCLDDAGAFAQDAGDFDDFAVTQLDGSGGVAAGAALSFTSGTKYFTSIQVANKCDPANVNTGWSATPPVNDGEIKLTVHVAGGGSTKEILNAGGSLTDGDSIL